MQIDISSLPDNPKTLKSLLLKTINEIETEKRLQEKNLVRLKEYEKVIDEKKVVEEKQAAEIARLNERIRLLQYRFFGPKSERLIFDVGQGELFNEAELTVSKSEAAEETEQITYKRRKKRKGRELDLSRHPCVEIIHKLPEEEKIHSCGQEMKLIGYEISYKVRIVPRQVVAEKHMREKFACPCDGVETEGVEGAVRTAPVPPQMLEKTIATPSLLADVITAKFCDALPFYRQEKIFNRYGFGITRETLSRWAIQLHERALVMRDLMEEDLLAGTWMGMDETHVRVMGEKDRKNTTKSYMWVRSGASPGGRIVLYDYRPTRSGGNAIDLLGRWKGTLVCDGYAGYDTAARANGFQQAGCWAHVRRKFHEAYIAAGKIGNAGEGLEYIQKMYTVEKEAKALGLDPDQRRQLRRDKTGPVLDDLKTWLDRMASGTPPKSLLGSAVRYTLGQWEKLKVFLEDGRLPLDNNLTENAIRPFVVGRKNWLFSACPRGADASAFLYSLVETAKASGIEPFWYLNYLFEKFPYSKGEKDYRALLPYNLTPELIAGFFKVDSSFPRYSLPV
jgi:transposase